MGWPDHNDPKLRAELAGAVSRLLAAATQRPYRPDLAQDLLAECGAACVEVLASCVGAMAVRQALEADQRQLEGRSGRYWPREPEIEPDGAGSAGPRRLARGVLADELRHHPAGLPSRRAVAWALLRVVLRRTYEELGAEGTQRLVRRLRDLDCLKLGERAA